MPRKTHLARPRQRPEDRASMRPRPDAAENSRRLSPGAGAASGFNEAAARCRGKRCGRAGELGRFNLLQ